AVAQIRDRKLEADKTAQLATLGLVAGAVARDLSTPLGSIAMQLEAQSEIVARLKEIIGPRADPVTGGLLEHAEIVALDAVEALRRAQSVNERLLALGRESQPEPLDLALVVRDCAAMMATELGDRGIAIELVESGDELWV